MKDQWIPVEKIQHLIQFEFISIYWIQLLIAFIFYKVILKKISEKRHTNLRIRFWRTSTYLLITTILATAHWIMFENAFHSTSEYYLVKIAGYLSFFALITGVISFIKMAQIYAYLYLFFMNMSVGVPRLIANIFTLVFSLAIISLLATEIFAFQMGAVLATSAVFSLVLGLALQDTLGNLFSGVALQIDRPFQIGDWVEIHVASEKLSGQVQEINWRATTLLSFADEFILIPNRLIAQGQLLNFSNLQKPARLNQVFRFQFNESIDKAKTALLEGVSNIPDILKEPAPRTLITEVTESWITVKIFYSLKDYGTRYRTGDLVITRILERVRFHHLNLATSSLRLVKESETDDY